MEEFVDKLLKESDQWVTQNALQDKSVFKSAIQKVSNELPSPSKEILSNHSNIINSLWIKLEQKYAESCNNKHYHFFSDIDINQYLNQQNESLDKKKALQSNNASLKHYDDGIKLNPFFKCYNNISYQNLNDLLDILLKNNQCTDEWVSLIQYRFNQLLANKLNSKKLSTQNIRLLSQKLYRLFCHNLGIKCIKKECKPQPLCLLFNQILSMCVNEIYCTDLSMNILSFIRILFEYKKENILLFEGIEKCIDMSVLISKLFELIMSRYNSSNKWSNTQQLIFLWTVYEYNCSDNINNKELLKLLKWGESIWSFNQLITVFHDKCIDSFADFINVIYKYNMLSSINENESNSEDEYDIMGIENDVVTIDNINDLKDEDLFMVDMNSDNNENKRLRNDSNDMDDEPATKKQKINEQ